MNSQLREGKWKLIIFLCWLVASGLTHAHDSSHKLYQLKKIYSEAIQKNPSFQKFVANLNRNSKFIHILNTDSSQSKSDSLSLNPQEFFRSNHTETQKSTQPKIPPRIIHIPVTRQSVNQEFLIIAKILDDRPHVEVYLNYRKGGDARFIQESMLRLKSFYQAKVPANLVTPNGIEYYITAIDVDSLISRIPPKSTFFIAVQVPEPGMAFPGVYHQNDSLSKWQLFSIPLQLETNRGKEFFSQSQQINAIEKINITKLLKNSETPPLIVPGRAFWRTATDTQNVIYSGSRYSVPTNSPFLIPLESGWNFIGNPFTFPVAVQHLYRNSDQPLELRTFHGRWNHPLLEPVSVLKPFEGYAIFNYPNDLDSLFIPAIHSPETILTHKHESLHKRSISWMIQLHAKSKNSIDIDNIIGESIQAHAEWDRFDEPEPPAIGDGVALFFDRPEWNKTYTRFCTDFRSGMEDGDIWKFNLQARSRENITLDFKGINGLPGQLDIWLVDDSLNTSRDLRLFPEYLVTEVDTHEIRTFKLIIGKKDFIDEKLNETITIPGKFQLAQNFPNPFNPETNIQYSLATAGEVTLKIFNLVGEEVLTLVDRQFQTAGYYIVTWYGQNELGLKMTSGIYVYQLWVNNFTLSRKMVLMK